MNEGLAWLGLEADADERAVKRAYAQRLRVTRPDEDPVGFQQLHEAYQSALAWLKFRDEFLPGTETVEEEDAPLPPEVDRRPSEALTERPPLPLPPAAVTAPSQPTPDENSFARTAIRKARRVSPEEMSRWLLECPELWSVTDKPWLGDALLQRLYALRAPVHEDTFDVLATFFGWNDVSSGTDAFELEQCRARLHDLWLMRQNDVEDPTVYRAGRAGAVGHRCGRAGAVVECTAQATRITVIRGTARTFPRGHALPGVVRFTAVVCRPTLPGQPFR